MSRFEPRIPGLRRILRLREKSIQADVDDEIAFHMESRVRDLMARGTSEPDARRIAASRFGDVYASRRELAAVDRHRRRRERLQRMVDGIAQDLRHAGRSLRRSPAFTSAAIATLAIGVGAAIAVFAVVDGVLLRPLPFRDPGRLVGAWYDMPKIGLAHVPQAASTYFTLRDEARTISGIAIYDLQETNVADRASPDSPQRVSTTFCTATLFRVLGVAPIRGRAFSDADDRPGAAPVVILSESMWRAQFGADPSIVGRTLDVDGVPREVVGIMPASFRFPNNETRLWVPLALDPVRPPANAFNYPAVARLSPGASVSAAAREFTSLLPRVAERYPSFVPGITTSAIMDQVRPQPSVIPLREDTVGAIAGMLWLIAAAAGMLLLVGCVNVANLSLVRFDARRHELAVRQAIGAGSPRVARYLFSESAVLAGGGGLLGLALAWAMVRSFIAFGPTDVPRLAEVTFDWRIATFAVAAAVLNAVGCCLIPVLRVARGRVELRQTARGGTASRWQHRVRGTLVAAQVALSVAVLAASGLLFRSFQRLHSVRLGFDPDRVATYWVSLPPARYANRADVARYYANLVRRVAAVPGVQTVGLTSRVPLVGRGMNQNPLYPEGTENDDKKLPALQLFTTVGGDYFGALRIPLVAGRTFEPMETQRYGDALISRRTAQIFWKDSSGVLAVGKRFRALPSGPLYTVIGVVDDAHDTTLADRPSPTVYFPEVVRQDSLTRQIARTMAVVARTTADPATITPLIERAARELDPTLPTFAAQPMTEVVRASTARLAFVTLVLGAAALITLVLGGVGLYGIMAYAVTLRRREIGIRIALGASPRGVAAATARGGVSLTSIGVVVGIVVFALGARLMRTLLFGVAPWDPVAIGGAAAVLMVIALLASWGPARRAARVNPVDTLRSD
jgi:putative ABC transport system permease protein